MFKNGLIFFLTTLVGFNSLAFTETKESKLYLKMITTVSKVSDIKAVDEELNFNLNHESSLSPAIGVGVGYYINNNIRVDLMFEHLKFNFNNQSAGFNCSDDDTVTTGTKSVKRTTSGKSLMLNGFIDLVDRNSFKFFVGTGVGAVRIKEKINHALSGSSTTTDQTYTFPLITEHATSKVITKFAHSLMLGTSIQVKPQLNIELIYSWKNFGKVKHDNLMNNQYKGHHFSIATRFDL
jgi:opacity protein-like surface antigen